MDQLQQIMWQGHYRIKPGTTASYTATDGIVYGKEKDGRCLYLLPKSLYIIRGEYGPRIRNSGLGTKLREGQMKGRFTKREVSPYKIANPFQVCTSIWPIAGHRGLFYGTIGITMNVGIHPRDNGDLVVFYAPTWQEFDVFIFRGLARPNPIGDLHGAINMVLKIIENGR